MHEKNFDDWGELKKKIHDSQESKNIREGDIWFCSVGINVGHEQDGKNQYFERPVLVIRKFTKDYFWGIPLTSVTRVGPYSIGINFNDKDRTALLLHLRSYDTKRLQRKLGSVSHETMEAVLSKLLLFFKSKDPVSRV